MKDNINFHLSESSGGINTNTDVKKFSKRYSKAGRTQLAEEIKELRFKHFKKQEGGELTRTVELNVSEIEQLKTRQSEMERDISSLQEKVKIKKGRAWSKVKDFFRKVELEEELQIVTKRGMLIEIEKDILERIKIIEEIQIVINDTSLLEEAKQKLANFYSSQAELKSIFEREGKDRDVTVLSKEKGYIFLHGVPTKLRQMLNTSANNPTLNTKSMDAGDKLSFVIGLEPTISVSVVKEGNSDLKAYYPFGIILGGGEVLSAYKEDSGTIAEGLHSRRSKYDAETKSTNIQPEAGVKLQSAVDFPLKHSTWGEHNEVVVEDPKAVGLYLDLSNLQGTNNVGVEELREYVEKLNLPVFALRGGEFFRIDLEEDIKISFETIGLTEIIGMRKDLTRTEKLEMVMPVMENHPFIIDGRDHRLFIAYQRGAYSVSDVSKEGYGILLRSIKRYEGIKRTHGDIDYEPWNPGTPQSILEGKRQHLLKMKDRSRRDDETSKSTKFVRDSIEMELMGIYGFALSARENGDLETYNFAEALIREFGSMEDCQRLLEKRMDERGNFKVLDSDVPIEIRQKIAELKTPEISK